MEVFRKPKLTFFLPYILRNFLECSSFMFTQLCFAVLIKWVQQNKVNCDIFYPKILHIVDYL